MPYGMPSIIMKGYFLSALDSILNSDLTPPALNGHRTNLLSTTTYLPDLLTAAGVIPVNHPWDQHLRADWFPPPGQLPPSAWWPGIQPVEPIAKKGYASAIRANLVLLSNGLPARPFDSYWVCLPWNATNPQHFQVVHMVSPKQITVVVVTPPEPGGYGHVDREPEETYYVKRKQPVAGLEELELWEEGGEEIALYQVLRPTEEGSALTPFAAMRKAVSKKKAATKKTAKKKSRR